MSDARCHERCQPYSRPSLIWTLDVTHLMTCAGLQLQVALRSLDDKGAHHTAERNSASRRNALTRVIALHAVRVCMATAAACYE